MSKNKDDKQDFFDSHFVIIGLDGKENEKMKSKIKDQLEKDLKKDGLLEGEVG